MFLIIVKKIFILLIFFYIFKNISLIGDGVGDNKLKITKLKNKFIMMNIFHLRQVKKLNDFIRS